MISFFSSFLCSLPRCFLLFLLLLFFFFFVIVVVLALSLSPHPCPDIISPPPLYPLSSSPPLPSTATFPAVHQPRPREKKRQRSSYRSFWSSQQPQSQCVFSHVTVVIFTGTSSSNCYIHWILRVFVTYNIFDANIYNVSALSFSTATYFSYCYYICLPLSHTPLICF